MAGAAFLNDPKPLRFHSARFELSLPLPDGHGWKIDDHKAPVLVATHAATDATLTVAIWTAPELMNRQHCEDEARKRDLVHDAELQTVADEIVVGPGSYDTHVTVAALPSTVAHRTLSGHVMAFGGHMKKCFFLHYETREREGEDEATLSARLAVARLQILGGVKVEVFDAPVTANGRAR